MLMAKIVILCQILLATLRRGEDEYQNETISVVLCRFQRARISETLFSF